MKKKLTKNASSRSTGFHFALLSTVFIISYASNSFANRPAMENSENNVENTPSAPSAMEVMMQHQQTQQTGDVLNLPAEEIQPGETIKMKLLDLPRRGSSMAKVKQEFGEPINISDTVGKPPITSWSYPDRIVYFEYSTVLHVVAR